MPRHSSQSGQPEKVLAKAVPLAKTTGMSENKSGAVAFLFYSFKSSFKGFLGLCKQPQMLLPSLILAVLWLVLSIAKTRFPDIFVLSVLSFFTFAQGGMYAGLLGVIGGIIGKALLAWFVTELFTSRKTGQRPFAGTGKKLKALLACFALKQQSEAALLLGGIGGALIAYNFLTGNGAVENSVIGITASISCLRVLKNPRSFLKGFILSFQRKRRNEMADRLIAGLTLGFPLGILISLLRTGWICYAIGAAVVTVAIVLALTGKRNRRATQAVLLLLLLCLPLGTASAAVGEGNWVFKNVEHFEETENGELTSVEDYIQFTEDYKEGKGSFSYRYDGESGGDWLTGENAAGTMTIGELPKSITGNQSIEVSITGKLSKNETGGGLFGISVSVHSVQKEFTQLDDGFREGESFTTKNGVDSLWISAGSDGTEKVKDVLTSPGFFAGSDDGDGRFLTVVTEMTVRGGGNKLYHYYDVYQYEWSGEDGGTGQSSEGEWMTPYEAYGIETGDFIGLSRAMCTDPPVGIRFRPGSAGLFGVDNTYTVQSSVDQNPWITIMATAAIRPDTVYTLERGQSITFHVQSDTIHGSLEDSDVSPYGSLSADFTWTMPASPQIDETSYRRTYKNYIGVESDFTLDAWQVGWDEEERILKSAPFNGSHSDKWDIDSDAFYVAKEGGDMEGTRPDNCWLVVYLSPSLTDISGYGEEPGVLYFEILEVKRGSWSALPATGGSEEEDETEYDPAIEDDFWNKPLNLPGALALGVAATLAAAMGAGAAGAGGGGGRPPLPDSPYIETDEDDPDSIVIHYPNGAAELFHWNEKNGSWEDPYGNGLQIGTLDQAMEDQTEDLRRIATDIERTQKGTDGDSLHWHKLKKMDDIQKEMAALDDPDGMGDRVAKRLQKIRDDMNAGKGFDQDGYDKVRDVYGKIVAGTMAKESELPEAYTTWQNWKDMTGMTGEELARGQGWKSISVRVGAAIVTGGYSEFGFETARAATMMKDYVDAGGDSAAEAFVQAATQTIIDEGIGRGIGLGLKAGSTTIRYTGKMVAKPFAKAVAAAKPIMTDLVKKAANFSAKIADTAAKAAKAASGSIDDAAKATSGQIDDFAKAAAHQTNDMAKAASNQIDDVAKSVANQTDEISKSAAAQGDEIAKSGAKQGEQAAEKAVKAEDAIEQAKKKAEEFIEKQQETARKEADDLINRYRDKVKDSPELSRRHEAFQKGRELAEKKITNMEKAKQALEKNPHSQEARKTYEKAVQEVQKDKHAIHKLNEMGEAGTETRSGFNTEMKLKDARADANTKARIAEEFGSDSSRVHTVNASNSMKVGDAAETAGVAKRPKGAIVTDGRKTVVAGADDIKVPKDAGSKTGFDTDKTYRIEVEVKDPVTGQTKTVMKDIPAEDVKRIYNEEYYKQWHDGKLPTKVDAAGKEIVDADAVNQFAKDMDVAAVDMHSAEGYGMGSGDLQNAIKSDNSVKNFKDVGSVTKTMEHKSTEWANLADDLRGNGDVDALPRAESFSEESIRQATKQYQNQVIGQVKALNTSLGNNTYRVPERLATAMEILKKIGSKPGDISVAEAEAILKSCGTNIDDVIQQSSSLMESMSKLRK